jgi:hypothetical protein
VKGPWPPWAARESADGRLLPPAPMPPVLAALTDPTKAGPGPHDTPDELAARVRTLAAIRRERTPLNPTPEETRWPHTPAAV